MKIGHYGSCLSAIPCAHLVDQYGCKEVLRIHHNRSDQFLKYFVDRDEAPIDRSWLENFLRPKPEYTTQSEAFLENQYFPTIGFENTLRDKVSADSNFIETLRTEKLDVILFDNFMDVVGRLFYLREIEPENKKSIFFPKYFYENDKEIDIQFRMGEALSPKQSAKNWMRIYSFFRSLQPDAKFYFVTWSHSTSRDNPERFRRIIEFYRELISISVSEDIHVIPPMDVPQALTEGPSDWYHMKDFVYKGLAGYIYAHANGNMPVQAMPNEHLINIARKYEEIDWKANKLTLRAEFGKLTVPMLLLELGKVIANGKFPLIRDIFFAALAKFQRFNGRLVENFQSTLHQESDTEE